MKRLRAYYERELGTLRGYSREFAAAFPAQARQLGMAADPEDDPHIARLIQATALSNARIAQLIDDNDTKITEALLSVNYPHYLQPFPAASIIQIDTTNTIATSTATQVIARGSKLSAKIPDGPSCKFRTVYDIALAPVSLSKVKFHPVINLPPAVPRPQSVTASLSLDLEWAAASGGLHQLPANALRCYINADPALSAVTRDVLFLQARAAYLEVTHGGWQALAAIPLQSVGLDAQDAMIESGAASHPAYRLLIEYFAFPDKFNFFDIDWQQLLPYIPAGCRQVTLHIGLGIPPTDSSAARALAALGSANFLLRCSPIINLFKLAASPIELSHTEPDYALLPDAQPASAHAIYSVDRVTMVQHSTNKPAFTEFRPYYSLRHGDAPTQAGHYYLIRRDPQKAVTKPGHEMRIILTDRDLDPLSVSNASASIDLTCTNRDLPSQLHGGSPDGDMLMEQINDGSPVRLLHAPTPQRQFSADQHWRLISHLALGHASLVQECLSHLTELLTLHDLSQSPISQNYINGITALSHRRTTAWLHGDGHATPVHGIEVRLSVDEDSYTGSGLHLFAQILDHFFGLYVHLNSFSQLVILSQTSGKELIRCQPRNGATPLI